MSDSVWRSDVTLPSFPSLTHDIATDVLIVGGGIAGLLTAWHLQQRGVPYVLVEKDRICSHTTGNTTAKITYQHGFLYHKLLKSKGKEYALSYLRANMEAFKQYTTLCKTVDCDYELRDNYVYSLTDRQKAEDEMRALEQLGYPAHFHEKLPLPFLTAGAVCFPNQAQFHPLKFLAHIAAGLNIFEHTFVRELIGTSARTDHAKIYAKRIVIATHFPMLNKHGSYFIKLYQHRSYVLGLSGAQPVDGMYVDESKCGLSFRSYGDLLLLGGGSHRTGKKGGCYEELQHTAQRYYPNSQIAFRYATQDCMSLDDVPYIGQYSARTEGIYTATGFNKWGMTGSMVAAMLLSDLLTGKKNDYAEIFSPSRSILTKQLFINLGESTVNLLTPTKKRCPHLGCALKWNRSEHSWDCPCHGSRFTKSGRLLDNPANGDLK